MWFSQKISFVLSVFVDIVLLIVVFCAFPFLTWWFMSIERKSEDRGTKWENIKKKKKKNESKTLNSLQAANFFY